MDTSRRVSPRPLRRIGMRARLWLSAGLTALGYFAGPVTAQNPPAPAAVQPTAGPAAIVNGEVVPWVAVMAEFAKRPPTLTPLSPSQQRQMQREIVNTMIDELLLRQYLAKNAPPVTEADVA